MRSKAASFFCPSDEEQSQHRGRIAALPTSGMRTPANRARDALKRVAVMVMILVSAACGGGSPSGDGSASDGEGTFSFNDPPAWGGAATTCFWFYGPVGGPEGINIAYPDGGAQYVNAIYRRPAGSRLYLKGKFPHARYSSIITYDGTGKALDGLADYQIVPDEGSSNPFRYGADRTVPDGNRAWTVEILDEINPSAFVKVRYGEEDRNVVYARSESFYEVIDGQKYYLETILYRTYIPDAGYGSTGGAGYPEPVLVLQDGTELRGDALCAALDSDARSLPQPRMPTAQALFIPQETYVALRYPNKLASQCEVLLTQPPEFGGNGCPVAWAGGPVPDAAPQQSGGTPLLQTPRQVPSTFPARKQGQWRTQFDRRHLLQLYTGDNAPGAAYDPVAGSGGGGFYPNVHNQYVRTAVHREFGKVLVVRGKLPTSPTSQHGDTTFGKPGVTYQVRYTSLCMNESFRSTRVMNCVYDEQMPLDGDGFYTVVFSSGGDRPVNARTECGFAWAEWKTSGDGAAFMGDPLTDPGFGMLQLRNMLSDPSFAQATFNVTKAGTEREVMGPYLPELTYMSIEQFQERGCAGAAK